MSPLEALLLGIIQGATEFLPISSSGHLVLSEALLGVEEGGLLLEVTLHAGTLVAVIIYFRARLFWMAREAMHRGGEGDKARKYILWLLIATVPAGLAGLLFEDAIARVFESSRVALAGLLITGAILFSSRWCRERGISAEGPPGLWMGLAQAVAIIPGISRSGSTIATGMWCGVDRRDAAEFSFLLSIPAIGGASILQVLDLLKGTGCDQGAIWLGLILGFTAALLSGYAAIAGLLEVLRRRGLAPFAWYCWAVGMAGMILI